MMNKLAIVINPNKSLSTDDLIDLYKVSKDYNCKVVLNSYDGEVPDWIVVADGLDELINKFNYAVVILDYYKFIALSDTMHDDLLSILDKLNGDNVAVMRDAEDDEDILHLLKLEGLCED